MKIKMKIMLNKISTDERWNRLNRSLSRHPKINWFNGEYRIQWETVSASMQNLRKMILDPELTNI